jgi:hypothetical protein
MDSAGALDREWREFEGSRKPLAQACNALQRPDSRAPTPRPRSPLSGK